MGSTERSFVFELNAKCGHKIGPNKVFVADQRQLKASDDFIAYKNRFIIRGGVDMYKNMKAPKNLRKFKKYLEDFPQTNKDAFYKLPF